MNSVHSIDHCECFTSSYLRFLFLCTQEIFRFVMYVTVPVMTSVIYANPQRMHDLSKFMSTSHIVFHLSILLVTILSLLHSTSTTYCAAYSSIVTTNHY